MTNVLEGKAAIVTGSARGIGRATAELLAAQGARVLVNDVDAGAAEEAAAEIGDAAAVFAADLTADGMPDALVHATHRLVRTPRHRREQRRLHLGWDGAQDE